MFMATFFASLLCDNFCHVMLEQCQLIMVVTYVIFVPLIDIKEGLLFMSFVENNKLYLGLI